MRENDPEDAVIAAFKKEHGRKPRFGEIRDYPGMNGVTVQRKPVIPAPERRVRAFLDENAKAIERHGPVWDWISSAGYGADLSASDIRDVLNELESWRDRAEELEDKRREAITRYLSVHAHYNDDVRLAIEVLSDEP